MSALVIDPLVHLRPMRKEDLSAVMEVELAAYEYPWTEGIFRDCLRVGYCCWVCELPEKLVGHSVMSIASAEAHVLNVCVDPAWQGHGLGRRMVNRLLRVARDHGADTAYLEVRVSNETARSLYESAGFCEVGTRYGYYPARSTREDAIVYASPLSR